MLTLVLLLLTQIPCAPNDLSVVCNCKQGMRTACETLRLSEPERAAELLSRLEQAAALAKVVEDVGQKAEANLQAEASSSTDCSEPTQCKGQLHHIISKRIADALEEHETLGGHYKARDPRFVSRAADEKSHCGYQEWHRKVDEEVVRWLDKFRNATPKQFEDFLREIYNRPLMRARFPRGF
ncbi:Wall-associated protein precursor [Archangium violaceum]|uniref:Wall-associated protein precursor n=1 Tax=Archangium violaceum TaxID=83451 RepID=UPI002B310AE0|nr:Wall-associated protein precursor [Archangium violaceum]